MKLTQEQRKLFHSLVEKYPNHPKVGITFSDLSIMYTSPEAMKLMKQLIYENIGPLNPDCVIGTDARGFITGTIIADVLEIPLILARKAGKLPPCELISRKYKLEYGEAELEMHKHIISKYNSPVISDDVLATAGTARAISEMIGDIGIKPNSYFFISEIVDLNGRDILKQFGGQVFSIIK